LRAKLVLLAVAALVFAPGWGADAAPHDAEASDLAGHILAPTVDEANSAFDRPSHRHVRGKLRAVSGKEFAAVPAGTQLSPNASLWVSVFVASFLSVLVGIVSKRSARAPPHLVTV
jgi:hypothetical protein